MDDASFTRIPENTLSVTHEPWDELFSSLSHLTAAGFSVVGLVLLVITGASIGSVSHIVGFSIYGASLILLYLASGLYHAFSHERKAKHFFHKLDHAMIYVLIAGTYTPIGLTFPEPGWGWTLFGVLWGLALLGIGLTFTERFSTWMRVTLYITMGWLILPVFFPVLLQLPRGGAVFLVLGGFLYTVGAIFFSLESRIPRPRFLGFHDIFHLLVIGGSLAHFWFMYRYLPLLDI